MSIKIVWICLDKGGPDHVELDLADGRGWGAAGLRSRGESAGPLPRKLIKMMAETTNVWRLWSWNVLDLDKMCWKKCVHQMCAPFLEAVFEKKTAARYREIVGESSVRQQISKHNCRTKTDWVELMSARATLAAKWVRALGELPLDTTGRGEMDWHGCAGFKSVAISFGFFFGWLKIYLWW